MHCKIADIRADALNKVSTTISKKHAIVVVEDLRIGNMTASPRGTIERPGRNVAQKRGFVCVQCGHAANAGRGTPGLPVEGAARPTKQQARCGREAA